MSRNRLAWVALLACLGLAGLTGCDRPRVHKVVPVEGLLTLDDKPLANVYVEFYPDPSLAQAPGSQALTDPTGHFVLVTADNRKGAVVGKHNVKVRGERADERSGSAGTVKLVPEKYTQIGPQNPLGQIEVTEGRLTYDIAMKSK